MWVRWSHLQHSTEMSAICHSCKAQLSAQCSSKTLPGTHEICRQVLAGERITGKADALSSTTSKGVSHLAFFGQTMAGKHASKRPKDRDSCRQAGLAISELHASFNTHACFKYKADAAAYELAIAVRLIGVRLRMSAIYQKGSSHAFQHCKSISRAQV